MSIQPETLAWLRQTAKFEGAVTAQAILHLLERVEALEADATEQSQSSSFCNEAIVKRLEALEQWLTCGDFVQVPPTPEAAPVATDAELQGLFKDQPMTWGQALRAAYNLGRQHGAAQPPFAADKVVINCPETCWVEVRRVADGKVLYDNFRRGTLTIPVGEPPAAQPAPAGGLVEQVESVIRPSIPGDPNVYQYESRAAIREVAAWLDRYGCHGCSLWLREEAGRA